MEKSTVKVLGRGLQQSFKPPEDLPFPLQKALDALAKLPPDPEEKCSADAPPKTKPGD